MLTLNCQQLKYLAIAQWATTSMYSLVPERTTPEQYCTGVRCWSPVSKRPNSAWTLPSKSLQTMPPPFAISRHGGGGGLVTLGHHFVLIRVPDGDILQNNDTTDEAANRSQLAVANLDMPIRLPSHCQPSSPDITLLSRHLLHDVVHPHHLWVWPPSHSHLPLHTAEGLLLHELPQCWLGGIHSRVRERICWPTSTNFLLYWGKCLPVSSATLEDTISPVAMLGTRAALFPMLCDPSSQRETSAAWIVLSTLPFRFWTGTSRETYAR